MATEEVKRKLGELVRKIDHINQEIAEHCLQRSNTSRPVK